MKLHESGENYLETILILEKRLDVVRSIDVARELDFSKPSVSRAISILKDDDYVLCDARGHLTLTETGRKVAETIYERHHFFTRFLIGIGVPEIAEKDACRIEHVLSPISFEKLRDLIEKSAQVPSGL